MNRGPSDGAGIRSRKRDWSAPPSSTVLCTRNYHKKGHPRSRNEKFPPFTARTPHAAKQTGNVYVFNFSLIIILSRIRSPRVTLYARNENSSTDLRGRLYDKRHATMENAQNNGSKERMNSTPSIVILRIDQLMHRRGAVIAAKSTSSEKSSKPRERAKFDWRKEPAFKCLFFLGFRN